jgi:hypothetical protein
MSGELSVELDGQIYVWTSDGWYDKETYQAPSSSVIAQLEEKVKGYKNPYLVENIIRFIGRCLLNLIPGTIVILMIGIVVIWEEPRISFDFSQQWLEPFMLLVLLLLMLFNASVSPVIYRGRRPEHRQLRRLSRLGIFGLTIVGNLTLLFVVSTTTILLFVSMDRYLSGLSRSLFTIATVIWYICGLSVPAIIGGLLGSWLLEHKVVRKI